MNIDDLHDALHDDKPEGLDGLEMLHLAQRARTRRRVGALGVGAAAAVTAFAVVWGTGTLNRPSPDPALTATPVRSTTVSSPDPSTPDPSTPNPSSPAPSSVPPATFAKVTTLCTPTNGLPAFTSAPGVVAVAPHGEFVLTSDGPTATLTRRNTSTQILSVPGRQGVIEAATDGRFVVLAVAVIANSDEPGRDYYVWDADKGGQAARVMSLGLGGGIRVRDGFAIVEEPGDHGLTTLHLLDLAAGTQKVAWSGEAATWSLLDGGKYSLSVPGPKGVQVVGTGPTPPSTSSSGAVAMYSPIVVNGSSWVFFDNADQAAGSMVVWSPEMPAPVPVFKGNSTAPMPQVGTNFVLLREADGPWHLVDLRTGGRITLPASQGDGVDSHYVLTPDDVLLRDPMDTRSAGPSPKVDSGWADLSGTTFTC